eukprot:11142358-Prorocentrum_lima.AAC.1
MLQEGKQGGAGADASTVCARPDLPMTCKLCHTLGRRRLPSAPVEEVSNLVVMGIGSVLGRSKI